MTTGIDLTRAGRRSPQEIEEAHRRARPPPAPALGPLPEAAETPAPLPDPLGPSREDLTGLFAGLPAAARPQEGSRAERTLYARLQARSPEGYAQRASEQRRKAARLRSEIARIEARPQAQTLYSFVDSTQDVDLLKRHLAQAERDAASYERNEEPFALYQAIQEKAVEPATGFGTAFAQGRFIPGEQEIQRRRKELRAQGFGRVEAARLAYVSSDLPRGVKGLLELPAQAVFDPLNVAPFVGFGGTFATFSLRGAATLAKISARSAVAKGLSSEARGLLENLARSAEQLAGESALGGRLPLSLQGPSGELAAPAVAGGARVPPRLRPLGKPTAAERRAAGTPRLEEHFDTATVAGNRGVLTLLDKSIAKALKRGGVASELRETRAAFQAYQHGLLESALSPDEYTVYITKWEQREQVAAVRGFDRNAQVAKLDAELQYWEQLADERLKPLPPVVESVPQQVGQRVPSERERELVAALRSVAERQIAKDRGYIPARDVAVELGLREGTSEFEQALREITELGYTPTGTGRGKVTHRYTIHPETGEGPRPVSQIEGGIQNVEGKLVFREPLTAQEQRAAQGGGQLQTGMGIGEAAPQGTLFGETPVGGTATTSTDPAQLAAQQSMREAVARGQQNLPEGISKGADVANVPPERVAEFRARILDSAVSKQGVAKAAPWNTQQFFDDIASLGRATDQTGELERLGHLGRNAWSQGDTAKAQELADQARALVAKGQQGLPGTRQATRILQELDMAVDAYTQTGMDVRAGEATTDALSAALGRVQAAKKAADGLGEEFKSGISFREAERLVAPPSPQTPAQASAATPTPLTVAGAPEPAVPLLRTGQGQMKAVLGYEPGSPQAQVAQFAQQNGAPPPDLPPHQPPLTPGGTPPPPPRDVDAMLASMTDEPGRGLGIDATKILTHLYDRNFLLKSLEKQTGVPTHQLAQVVPGMRGAADNILRKNHHRLANTLRRDLSALRDYMILRRDQDILARFPTAQLPGEVKTWNDIQAGLDRIKAKVGLDRFQRIEAGAQQLWQWNDEFVLRPLRDAGLLSPESYEAILTNNPHYLPFDRADFVDILHGSFGTPKAEANLAAVDIKRLSEEGSTRPITSDVLGRLFGDVHKTRSAMARNDAAKGIVRGLEVLQARTGEEWVRWVSPRPSGRLGSAQRTGVLAKPLSKAERSRTWDTMSFFENGQKQLVDVPTEYAAVAKALEAEPNHIGFRIAQLATAPLRHGAITYNPAFLPVNFIRDAGAAIFRENIFPFLSGDWWRGLVAAITKNSLFDDAAEAGVFMSSIVESMRAAPGRGAPKVLTRGSVFEVRNPLDLLTLLPRMIAEANVTSERVNRIAAFSKLRGKVPELEAVIRARDVTVDFSKSGLTVRWINMLLPFLNAATQGQANILRTMRDHPVRSAGYGLLFASPAIMARFNNMRYETSEQIPDYEYTRNLVVQYAEGTRRDGSKYPLYFKLPVGEIGAIFKFPVEVAFNLARRTEDRSAAGLLLDMGWELTRVVSPIDIGNPLSALTPPPVGTGISLATNYDLFTGAPIIPRREQDLLSEQQFGPETGAMSIALGQKLGVSPRLIDFAINDYLAGAGQSSNWLLSSGMQALGFEPERFGEAVEETQLEGAERIARTPGISRFVGARGTQLERRGWERFDAAVEGSNRAFSRIEGVQALKLSLGEVSKTLNLLPEQSATGQELTPAQRAQYQEALASLAIPRIREFVKTLDGLTPEQQQTAIRKELSKIRREAQDKAVAAIKWPDTPEVKEMLKDRALLAEYFRIGERAPLPAAVVNRRRLALRDRNPGIDAALIRWGYVDSPRTAAGRVALLRRKRKEAA